MVEGASDIAGPVDGRDLLDVARLEQLYPRPAAELSAELARFTSATTIRWVQDEPANMGAWPHMALHFTSGLGGELGDITPDVVARAESSSPSVGQHSRHVEEQKDLLQRAFA